MTQWNLDYEIDNEGSIAPILETLTNKTFDPYTIDIKNCEIGTSYEYILDEQFVWDLR